MIGWSGPAIYAWHAGLPLESLLTESRNFEVRGWEFGNIVGLDIAGVSKDGRHWRWIGAPIADAIGYEDATPDEAAFFDGVLQSICYSQARQP